MKEVQLVFFSGLSPVSKLIKKITGSELTHVAFYNQYDDKLIESWVGKNTKLIDFISFAPIKKFNEIYSWKYSSFHYHTPGTPYIILSKEVPDDIYSVIDTLFTFMAEYNIPYDLLGILGRISDKLDSKYGMFCSEGCQNILTTVQDKYKNKYNIDLTDTTISGYLLYPDKLFYLLKSRGWKESVFNYT